jgi:hypothetical protein
MVAPPSRCKCRRDDRDLAGLQKPPLERTGYAIGHTS